MVLDPRTGAVLAMYSNPNYDPQPLTSPNSPVAAAAWKAYTKYNAQGFALLGLGTNPTASHRGARGRDAIPSSFTDWRGGRRTNHALSGGGRHRHPGQTSGERELDDVVELTKPRMRIDSVG